MRQDVVRRGSADQDPHHLLKPLKSRRKGTEKMSMNEIIKKVEYLQELEGFMEEIRVEADSIRDSIKIEMMEQGVEEMEAGKYIIRYTSVLSNRFDTTAFKKIYGDLYKAYTKQTASKRFSIA